MGMHQFRRLREREAAAAAIATAIAAEPPVDLLEPGTFDQHPPKRRGRRPKAQDAATDSSAAPAALEEN
jgi:hypothetical protein